MDDWLTQRLKDGSYLPDDGFTSRVAERLPAAQRQPWRMRVFVLAPIMVLVCALLAFSLPSLPAQEKQVANSLSKVELPAVTLHTPVLTPVVAAYSGVMVRMTQRSDFLPICLGAGIAAGLTLVPLLRRWA